MTLTFFPASTAQRYPVIKRAVIANFCRLTDDYTHAVINKKAATNGGSGMNLNASHPTAKGRQHTRQPLKAFVP